MVRVQCIVGEGRSQARTWKAVQVVEAGLQLVEVQALHSDDSLQCDIMAILSSIASVPWRCQRPAPVWESVRLAHDVRQLPSVQHPKSSAAAEQDPYTATRSRTAQVCMNGPWTAGAQRTGKS